MISELAIAEMREEMEHFPDVGAIVVKGSISRVLDGEQVPTAEKLYSIFETHTDLIKRGKVQTFRSSLATRSSYTPKARAA